MTLQLMPTSARAALTAAVSPTAFSAECTCNVIQPARNSYRSPRRSALCWEINRLSPSTSTTLARISTSGGRSSIVTKTKLPGRSCGDMLLSSFVKLVSPLIHARLPEPHAISLTDTHLLHETLEPCPC